MKKSSARKRTGSVSRTAATEAKMEQKQQRSEPSPESLLSHSAQLLGFRDFSGARKYALSAQNSDPTRTEPPQIIAIADVLLAAQNRLPATGLADWASVLQLDSSMVGDRACMRSQFTKLTSLVHPSKNRFPLSQEAFDHVCGAWAAMSAEEKGKSPEESRGNPGEGGEGKEEEGEKSERGSGTFWTVCPYCYYAYEYESAYEDCCLRCQNCRKGFHGLAVAQPPQLAGGNGEEYYCGYGSFPLRYSLQEQNGGGGGGNDGGKKKDGVKGSPAEDFVMEISDDSSEEKNGGEEKESERKKQGGSEGGDGVSAGNGQGSNGAAVRNGVKKGNYRKSIPKNPRKMMGIGHGSFRNAQQLRVETQDSAAKLGTTTPTTVEGMVTGESSGANQTGNNGGFSDSDVEHLVDDVYLSFEGMD